MAVGCSQPALARRVRDYVLGALPEEEANRFEDHVAGCSACAARVIELDERLERLPPRLREPPSRRLGRQGVWIGLAAAGVIAAILAVLPPWRRGSPHSEEALRSLAAGVELSFPLGEIDARPRELRWRVVPGFPACRASLVLADLTPVWTSERSTEGAVALPADLALQEDTTYLFRVSCGQGGEEAATPYAAFRLRRR